MSGSDTDRVQYFLTINKNEFVAPPSQKTFPPEVPVFLEYSGSRFFHKAKSWNDASHIAEFCAKKRVEAEILRSRHQPWPRITREQRSPKTGTARLGQTIRC